MKIGPEKIILYQGSKYTEKNIFLISGNEETLIKKIEKTLVEQYRLLGYSFVERVDNKKIDANNCQILEGQLFSESKILIYNNPKEIDLNFLNSNYYDKTVVIINHNKLNNSSQIKKQFDSHSNFVSISCFSLSKELKKLFFDNFLNNHNLKLSSSPYWFFIDNTPNEYQLFENEMLKLLNYNKKIESTKEMNRLITNPLKQEIDNLFFLLLNNYKDIILESQKNIKYPEDSYFLLQRIKFFFDLMSSSSDLNDAMQKFPKYLFKLKQKYAKIFSKINKNKMIKIYILIKKNEIMLRKYPFMHQSISQRFLLNLKKNLL